MGRKAKRERESETACESSIRIRAAIAEPLRTAVETVQRAIQAKSHESVRALWRIGDAVAALHEHAAPKEWRKLLAECSEQVGMHQSHLDDAARAARAFPAATREQVLCRFDESGTRLTRSHVIALARATPTQRSRWIAALLRTPMSVEELKAALRHTGVDEG